VLQERTIKGCWYGSSDIRRDVPRLVDLYRDGRLRLDELVSRRIELAEVNGALEALKAGDGARSVIVY
jgi:Zn-dependent alcohol dehydrogenase